MMILQVSCTDVVDVTVPNGGERLVVEASILWEKGTTGENQTIILSKSTEYFSDNPYQPVLSAIVEVSDDATGDLFIFESQNDGRFTNSNFIPILGNSYTLNIEYNDQVYTANETLKAVSEITNIEQTTIDIFGEDHVEVKIFFNDPINVDNYYVAEYINPYIALRELRTLDDEFTDGNQNFMEFYAEELVPGDEVEISLQGASEGFYNYMTMLEEQAESGGPFASTPAQLIGNCINIENSEEEVLGFFRLSEINQVTYTIE